MVQLLNRQLSSGRRTAGDGSDALCLFQKQLLNENRISIVNTFGCFVWVSNCFKCFK